MSVIDINSLDRKVLQAYFAKHLPDLGAVQAIEKFKGGQSNPTYRIDCDNAQVVLRSKPPGELLKSAHAVDREYRVQQALQGSDVPVAKMLHLCDDDSVIGRMFYVMAFQTGRVFWNPAIPEVSRDERHALYLEMARILAAIHDIDLVASGLNDYGHPGDYFERQITRFTKQWHASKTQNGTAMETLIQWLEANKPIDDGSRSLIHGDYRLDNIMFHHSAPKGLAVLDWELSTTGHPMADLAYQVMQWQSPNNGVLRGLDGEDRAQLNIPTDQQYISAYCQHRGLSGIDNWDFFMAFSLFRTAVILQGVYKRSLDGNASSDKAAHYGAMVDPLVASAVAKIRLGS